MGIALASINLTALPMAGQAPRPEAKSAMPRMPDGYPDLQGTYDLATMTPHLSGCPGSRRFLTKEQAEALQKAEAQRRAKDDQLLGARSPRPRRWAVTRARQKSFFEGLEKAGGGSRGQLQSLLAQPGLVIHGGRWTDSNIHRD